MMNTMTGTNFLGFRRRLAALPFCGPRWIALCIVPQCGALTNRDVFIMGRFNLPRFPCIRVQRNTYVDRPPGSEFSPVKLPNEIIPTKEKIDVSELPIIKFKGQIKYVNDFNTCAMICDNIIQEIEKYDCDVIPIGFDLEWPFSFQTGSGKTALAQICFNETICYLLHIYSLKKLPAAFVILLSHPKVKLVGVNIKNDIWKLGRDFSEFPASEVVQNNCMDCGKFANEVLNRSCRWSLERLTAYLLKRQIDKNPKVRRSQWHNYPLNNEQKIYAATDAYVSWLLHMNIQKQANEKDTEEKVT